MEDKKSKDYLINGIKPVNAFSMEILKNSVGSKSIEKAKKTFSSIRLGPKGTTVAKLRSARANKSLEAIPKVTSFNILNVPSNSIEEK